MVTVDKGLEKSDITNRGNEEAPPLKQNNQGKSQFDQISPLREKPRGHPTYQPLEGYESRCKHSASVGAEYESYSSVLWGLCANHTKRNNYT